jgi:hypothetical protein
MLQLTEAQWRELQARDAGNFVATICYQFLSERPDMVESPGGQEVQRRMQAAHDYAMRLGFTSNPHVVKLMYLAADAPGIHDDPPVSRYLSKPGATPEQRLDEVLDVMNSQLKQLEKGEN